VKQITKFCWIDDEQVMHFDIPTMLEAMGAADTPKNRAVCMAEIAKAWHEEFPRLSIEAHTCDGVERLYPEN
jgi:hypothetical protein